MSFKTRSNQTSRWLSDHLSQFLYSKKIMIPRRQVNKGLLDLHSFEVANGKYRCHLVGNENKFVRKFLLDNFYSKAPVPTVLGLYKDKKVTNFLEDELDLLCDNAASFVICDSNEVIGAFTNLSFEKSDKDIGYICAEEWLNTAAKLADEMTPENNPAHFWRNAQFLHLEHFGQHVAQKFDADFAFHLSGACLAENYRGNGHSKIILEEYIKNLVETVSAQGGVLTTVMNIPALEKFLMKSFANNIHIIDRVPYSALELKIHGQRVFEKLEKQGSIVFMAFA